MEIAELEAQANRGQSPLPESPHRNCDDDRNEGHVRAYLREQFTMPHIKC